ncbi:MAG: N-acetylmuramoyl-L-alanine amidase [Ruminococcaceae bacterium]|nr:N-acetylmuramoyl-L-alanine amidase [Oscillospiraceae bacterium]
MAKIYLDPGHGGYDSGAVGCGKRECDLTLQVALKVRALLTAAGVQVRMSRDCDSVPGTCDNVELPRRARDANNWHADIYASIHLNACPGGHGIETYRSVCGGKSTTLAQDIQTAVLAACPGYTNRGVKTKAESDGRDWICVIRESAMPACLVECGFIDSSDDMARFSADKFAAGIASGIFKYFGMRTAAAVPSAAADTTKDMAMSRLSVYQVKTYSGAKLSSGNSQIALVIPRTSDLWYVVAVGSSGQAAGIYTTLPGQKAKKAFAVKIK